MAKSKKRELLPNWENMIPTPEAFDALSDAYEWKSPTKLVITKTARQKNATVEMVAGSDFVKLGTVKFESKQILERTPLPIAAEIAPEIKRCYPNGAPKLNPDRDTPTYSERWTDKMIRLFVDMLATSPLD